MKDYRLYYSPGACSLSVHIALEELGVPYDSVRVTIAEGLNRTAEYLAVNPRGRVPALIYREGAQEQVLTEAMAILNFLARRHPEAGLLPTATGDFARALEWMGWLGSTVHQTGVRMVLRPDRFVSDSAAAPAVEQKGREMVQEAMLDIESRLRGKNWAVSGRYSLVDAYLLVFFRWGNRLGLPMRERFPEFTRIMDAVRSREAVRRAIEQEGIQIE